MRSSARGCPTPAGIGSAAQLGEQVQGCIIGTDADGCVVPGVRSGVDRYRYRGHGGCAGRLPGHGVGVYPGLGCTWLEGPAERVSARIRPRTVPGRRATQCRKQGKAGIIAAHGDRAIRAGVRRCPDSDGQGGRGVRAGCVPRHGVRVGPRHVGGGIEGWPVRNTTGARPATTSVRRAAEFVDQVEHGIVTAHREGAVGAGVRGLHLVHGDLGRGIGAGWKTVHRVGVHTRGRGTRHIGGTYGSASGSRPGPAAVRASSQLPEQVEGSSVAAYRDGPVRAGIRGRVHTHGDRGGGIGAGRSARHRVGIDPGWIGGGIERSSERATTRCRPRATGIRCAPQVVDQRLGIIVTARGQGSVRAGIGRHRPRNGDRGHRIRARGGAADRVGVHPAGIDSGVVRAPKSTTSRTGPGTSRIGCGAKLSEQGERCLAAADRDAVVGAGIRSRHDLGRPAGCGDRGVAHPTEGQTAGWSGGGEGLIQQRIASIADGENRCRRGGPIMDEELVERAGLHAPGSEGDRSGRTRARASRRTQSGREVLIVPIRSTGAPAVMEDPATGIPGGPIGHDEGLRVERSAGPDQHCAYGDDLQANDGSLNDGWMDHSRIGPVRSGERYAIDPP